MLHISAFEKCESLQVIHVEDDCEISLSSIKMSTSPKIVLPQEIVVLARSTLKLWNLKDTVIPGGIEKIGSYWFWDSTLESVTISSDIRKIGVEAFCNCKKLKKVVFKKMKTKKDTTLYTVRPSISQSGRGSQRVICTRAFYGCIMLADVKLPDGIEEIGIDAFSQTGLESITIPSSTRIVR